MNYVAFIKCKLLFHLVTHLIFKITIKREIWYFTTIFFLNPLNRHGYTYTSDPLLSILGIDAKASVHVSHSQWEVITLVCMACWTTAGTLLATLKYTRHSPKPILWLTSILSPFHCPKMSLFQINVYYLTGQINVYYHTGNLTLWIICTCKHNFCICMLDEFLCYIDI